MTSLYEMFETSADAEASGTWVSIGESKFLLARTGGANENFQKVAKKRLAPYQAALENLGKKHQDELAVGIFVDTVLLGWEGVSDRQGQPIEYTKESAKALLIELPNLFASLQAEAGRMSNFTTANLEAARKN
jgi:hypothetical protein